MSCRRHQLYRPERRERLGDHPAADNRNLQRGNPRSSSQTTSKQNPRQASKRSALRFEAIMLNLGRRGSPSRTGDNLFLMKKGAETRPSARHTRGVTPNVVNRMAKAARHPLHRMRLDTPPTSTPPRVILTGTAAEIIGVNKVDAHDLETAARPGEPLLRDGFRAGRRSR